ncbi:transposase [Methylicorpusculum oleiharenae]|uniref:REP-associated tyrosine transposase n=1 Tax=Methylicorpusculum oleiharenae TaxID=1338687 RepID=UPI001359706E|nr:transposase [Methylicorpusculum oleiharenae]MCD2449511.1 transposase [Methylicorpusculum oleiharenae]
MSNYRRVFVPGACYFFTVVTWRRTPIFIDEQRVEIFRQAIRKIMQTRPFHIDAMVILPEHLHCIWSMPDGDCDFSSRWREIKKATSRQIDAATNTRNERFVWQRRFWEHAIRDEDDWRRHMDYIHYNPVKHGLAQRPGDWPWSSFASAVKKGWYDASWGAQSPTTITDMDCE